MKVKNKEILCIGEVLWDRLPDKSIPGGAPMNVALHLKNVGYQVLICSSLGNDEAGRELAAFIESTGAGTQLIQTTDELPTSEVPIFLDENNNPTFDILEPVAWDQLVLTPELNEAASRAGTIVYGSLASRNEMTRNTVHAVLEYDNVKLMDINMRPPYVKQDVIEALVRKADIAKMNDDELRTMAGWHKVKYTELNDLARWCGDTYNLELICITRGKDGAMVLDKGEICEHPGFRVETVDTVGAGDAFLAGFVSRLFDGRGSMEALTYGCALGAYVATQPGATPAYHFDEIEKIMKQ
jgi:fructokinase